MRDDPECPEETDPEPEREIEQERPYDYVDYDVIERDLGHLLP